MAGIIVAGRNVAENRTLTPDFCIIGSGAAGGVCALKLTEAGFDVLVIEEGPDVPEEKGSAPGQDEKCSTSAKPICTSCCISKARHVSARTVASRFCRAVVSEAVRL